MFTTKFSEVSTLNLFLKVVGVYETDKKKVGCIYRDKYHHVFRFFFVMFDYSLRKLVLPHLQNTWTFSSKHTVTCCQKNIFSCLSSLFSAPDGEWWFSVQVHPTLILIFWLLPTILSSCHKVLTGKRRNQLGLLLRSTCNTIY